LFVEVNGYTIEPGADLKRAKLRGADLKGVDLSGAILSGADLSRAIMPNGTIHD